MAYNIYISGAADHLAEELDAASLADQPEKIRQITQAVDAANEIWKGWCLSTGGEVVSFSGPTFRLRIPAERLNEIEQLHVQYAEALDTTVSIGVGARVSEADKTLQLLQASGGDSMRLYDRSVEEDLASLEKKLQKADEMDMNSPAAGGGISPPAEGSGDGPPPETPPEQPQMSAPAASPAPMGDFHDQLGQLAQQQEASDQQEAHVQEQAGQSNELKQAVVSVLQVFKARAQELESLKQQDPELYQGLVTMVQTMTAMAQQVMQGQSMQKSESFQALVKDLMPGGKGDNKQDSDFIQSQLKIGIRTEMEEHGLDWKRAKEVAKDHLMEDAHYYSKLEKGWPKDAAENATNAKGFLREPVAQDHALELGAELQEEKPVLPRTAMDRNYLQSGSDKFKLGDLFGSDQMNSLYEQQDANARAEHQKLGIEYGYRLAAAGQMVQTPHGKVHESHFPVAPHNSWNNYSRNPGGVDDKLNDHVFWEGVDALSSGITLKELRARARSPKLDKAALEAGRTGRHQVVLPVGSQLDPSASSTRNVGKIKVQDKETGKTKWRSVRAGLVMDPQGNPVSSRNPSGNLGKAWPRDEKENQANEAAHPIMEDALAEQGYQRQEHGVYTNKVPPPAGQMVPLGGEAPGRLAHGTRAEYFWAENPEEIDPVMNNTVHNIGQGMREAKRYNAKINPYSNDFQPTSDWNDSRPTDEGKPVDSTGYSYERSYWIGAHPGGGSLSGLAYGSLPPGNATQIPTKTEMQSAWERSPVFKRKK